MKVGADLSVLGHPDIFVIGDAANASGINGRPLPGVAPVAKQQGRYVANLLKARRHRATIPLSRFRRHGDHRSQTYGCSASKDQAFRVPGVGAVERGAHLFSDRIPKSGARRHELGWSYVTFQRGTRLITGVSGSRTEDMARPQTAADPKQNSA